MDKILKFCFKSRPTTNDLAKLCLENGFILNRDIDINNDEIKMYIRELSSWSELKENDVVNVDKYGLCRICGTTSEKPSMCEEFGITSDETDGYFARVLDYEKYGILVLILDRNENKINFDFSDKAFFLGQSNNDYIE